MRTSAAGVRQLQGSTIGNEMFSVRGKGEKPYNGIYRKHTPLGPRSRVPYADCLVARARHDQPAVWREGDGLDRARMAL